MKPRLTEWFGPEVKPTIPGWYERAWGEPFSNDYWDGNHWYAGGGNNARATRPSSAVLRWRGLAEKPE